MTRGTVNNSKGPSWKMFKVDVPFILYTPLFEISHNWNVSLKVKFITFLSEDKDNAQSLTQATMSNSGLWDPSLLIFMLSFQFPILSLFGGKKEKERKDKTNHPHGLEQSEQDGS